MVAASAKASKANETRGNLLDRSWPWTTASLVLALVSVVSGVQIGWQITIALFAVFLAIAALFFRPIFVALGCLVLILFGDTLLKLTAIQQLAYVDEAAVSLLLLCSLKWAMANGTGLRWPSELSWFSAFIAVGVVSSIVASVPLVLVLQGTFLYSKPFVVAFAFAQINWNRDHFNTVAKFIGGLTAGILLVSIINVALPGAWSALLQRSGEVDIRFGLPSIIGPFVHPTYYGSILALCFLAIMSYRASVQKTMLNLILMIGAALGVILSFRRRIIIGLIISGLTVFGSKVGRTVAVFSGLFLVAVILTASAIYAKGNQTLGIIGQSAVDLYDEYIVEGATAARTRLTVDSFGVAVDNFPFGAGFANFGSFLARINYSDEYVALGYRGIYGLSDRTGWGGWLTDTQWPAIIGESGVLGTFFYIGGLVVIVRRFLRVNVSDANTLPWERCLAATGISWFVLTLVDSVASPTYTAPPTFPWLFALGAIVWSVESKKAEIEVSDKPAKLRKRMNPGIESGIKTGKEMK